ncbi:MAG: hypothetical protein P8129_13655 [Anaerolineae bacterium]|jgi:hypothetical protein
MSLQKKYAKLVEKSEQPRAAPMASTEELLAMLPTSKELTDWAHKLDRIADEIDQEVQDAKSSSTVNVWPKKDIELTAKRAMIK